MNHAELIDAYLAGPQLLRQAVAGMSADDLDARPVPGKMSTREVICHIADFEPVYVERMKRSLAEDHPPLRGGDPDAWRAALAYDARDVAEELDLIELTRKAMARILRTLPEAGWNRTGIHSEAGPLSVEGLLRRITEHIPHHIRFIEEKRQVLSAR